MASDAGQGASSLVKWLIGAVGVSAAALIVAVYSGWFAPAPDISQPTETAEAPTAGAETPDKPAERAQESAVGSDSSQEAVVADTTVEPETSADTPIDTTDDETAKQVATPAIEPEPEPEVDAEPVETASAPQPEDTAETQPSSEAPDITVTESGDATGSAEIPAEPVEEVADSTTATADSVASADPAAEPETQEPALKAASLDLIRVEADGLTTLAGRAAAGATVTVLLNDKPVHSFDADDSGAFAQLFSIDPSPSPRSLSLRSDLDGRSALSEDFLIAGMPVPEAVARADEAGSSEPSPVDNSAEPEVVENGSQADDSEQDEPADSDTSAPTEPVITADNSTSEANDPSPTTDASVPSEQVAEQKIIETADAPTDPEPSDETEQVPSDAQVAEAVTENVQDEASSAADPPTDPPSEPVVAATSEPEATDDAPAGAVETAESEGAADEGAAPTAPAVLRSDEEGVELVQSPEPIADQVQITLDTIGYSDVGNVQLTGRAGENATVRVYLNNRALTDLNSNQFGRWRGELQGIEPGVYTLRLDELDDTGLVLSRLETPFKREAPEVLLPATPSVAETTGGTAEPAPKIRAVTVQKGDTLWAISRERYGDGILYVKVFEANRDSIRNPDLIYPGQIFAIPE